MYVCLLVGACNNRDLSELGKHRDELDACAEKELIKLSILYGGNVCMRI